MNARTAFFIIFLGFMWGFSPPNAHAIDDWQTLKTAHFRVHHTKVQSTFAHTFAAHLERFLPLLTEDLAWSPPTPIDIYVNDNSDHSNGFARSFPANLLEVFPVPFDGESTLMDYYDWVEELAVHELTHIIANDAALGFYRPLSKIFGNTIRPNGLQPGWLVEGLAVFEETRLTQAGRGRSAFTEAVLRTATLHKKLNSEDYFSMDRFNDGVFFWPGGETRYLLGYVIQAALERKRTEIKNYPKHSTQTQSLPGLVSISNAGNWPYALDSNLESIIGSDWKQIWAYTMQILEDRYKLANLPPTNPSCQLTQAGHFTGGQAVDSQGRIYFIAFHPSTGAVLARMPLDSPCLDPKDLDPIDATKAPLNFEVLSQPVTSGLAKVALSPDEKVVAYAAMPYAKISGKKIYDLFTYNIELKKNERLTFNERARDPAFSVDGKKILFVKINANNTESIETLDLESKKRSSLYQGKVFERLSTPFARNNFIYFSRHNNRGQEELLKIPANASNPAKAQSVIPNFGKGKMYFERHPYVLNDGTIYFVGNYSGEKSAIGGARAEIYEWKNSFQAPRAITRTESGMSLWPVPLTKRKELLVANYSLTGMNLMRLNLHEPIASAEKNSTSLHEYLTNSQNAAVKMKNKTKNSSVENSTNVPYDAFSTPATSLWPQYWIPLFFSVTEGSQIGATTSGADPLGRHRYYLLALYDTRADFPIFSASYLNSTHSVGWGLEAQQNNNYFNGSNTSNRYNLYSARLIYAFNGIRASLGGAYQARWLGNSYTNNPFPFLSLSYGRAYTNSILAIASNQGYELSQYLAFFPQSQSEPTFWDYRPNAAIYFPGLWRNHAVSLKASAAFSTNHSLARNYFQGGGPVIGLNTYSPYIVRGYPEDTLFGTRILTTNFAYTLPLARIEHGWDIRPIFLHSLAFRFLADAGSANFIARYSQNTFLGYQKFSLARKFVYGTGGEFLLKSTLAYYAPLEFALGIHQGLNESFGGESRFYFSLNLSMIPGL